MMKTLNFTKVIHYNNLLRVVTFLSVLTVQVVFASPEIANTLIPKPSTPKPVIITTIKPLAIIAQSAVGIRLELNIYSRQCSPLMRYRCRSRP